MTPLDILGYLATGVVLLSFLWEGEQMRFINAIGAMLWMVWGFLLSQPLVWILNGLIILIQKGDGKASVVVYNKNGKF